MVYILVQNSGRVEAWKVAIQDDPDTNQDTGGVGKEAWTGTATCLVHAGCITSVVPFATADGGAERIMITRSDFDAAWVVETVDVVSPDTSVHLVDELRLIPSGPGLQASHHTITYPVGVVAEGRGYHVQAFVHTPLEPKDTSQPCRRRRKYPVMVLIHSGPNDAHREAWSVTWNPLLWTSRGFVVIAPNISGSVGFGLPFAHSIFQQWGGRPYDDIVALLDWLALNKDGVVEDCQIDTDKVLCSGYSYGGYLVNWIAGQQSRSQGQTNNNSIKFRALTVHGGVFSPRGLLGSDLPLAFAYDFGGFPWEGEEGEGKDDDKINSWTRWDPARFARNWRTMIKSTAGHDGIPPALRETGGRPCCLLTAARTFASP
ncbi:Putative peptidase S9, prolyl oligopeptidase, catalytic domain, alpha/Beta hydrolase [Colletotrichum destructivum]|uniref:Dipeptidyl-peptidase V n=1 Tax=Colletotrichum destructivum TaxID=34406 RepID=A0AAX4IY79_9PEZI|nr:Putative peptidase S9, prolyl oligopeptidase, catalytic domain, alpha/Beta hydrolase [Colletotrichum destructivum]